MGSRSRLEAGCGCKLSTGVLPSVGRGSSLRRDTRTCPVVLFTEIIWIAYNETAIRLSTHTKTFSQLYAPLLETTAPQQLTQIAASASALDRALAPIYAAGPLAIE